MINIVFNVLIYYIRYVTQRLYTPLRENHLFVVEVTATRSKSRFAFTFEASSEIGGHKT